MLDKEIAFAPETPTVEGWMDRPGIPSSTALKDRLWDHLHRMEEVLFQNLNEAHQSGGTLNASLARELRQTIHDLLERLEQGEETESADSIDLTLIGLRKAHAMMKQREGRERSP